MLGQVAEVSKSCGTPGESDKREHNMILYIYYMEYILYEEIWLLYGHLQ